MSYVFAYGSLKKGFHNARHLKNSKFVGTFMTTPEYEMFSLYGFPGIHPNGDYAIKGEIYEIDERVLKNLDRLECEGRMYERNTINVDGFEGEVFLYVFLLEKPLQDYDGDIGYVHTENGVQSWEKPNGKWI